MLSRLWWRKVCFGCRDRCCHCFSRAVATRAIRKGTRMTCVCLGLSFVPVIFADWLGVVAWPGMAVD